ncbi:P-loop containing nucleoside triphosphate hydrolase protein [Mycena vulgaris]|nr:P-loop containing nucleoside triphosphate hydrolase protein [Mycena vulgaris]
MSDTFTWSSPEGYSLVRRILEPTPVLYIPHDYQLEGVCKSLDGVNLFGITPTGSGKTSYYIIYIIVLLAVVKDPSLCPSAKFPENPCLIIICPTIPLQLEMVRQFPPLGLDSLAINSETRADAQQRRNEDLWTLARTKPNVILTGPEQLKTADFEKALRDDTFYDRICGTGFDEVHLLNTWGSRFRKDFGQMGFVKARMPDRHNPWILTSATVRKGRPFDSICALLGLHEDDYHLIRRSSARPDVQILFRDLVSPISSDSFPELDWVLTENRPTVIFPKSISLASRIYGHLVRTAQSSNTNRIRTYNSLNFDSYNSETRELLKAAPTDANYCQIVIGTDSLSVGVGMPRRLDAILIGTIDDTDEVLQKLGRVGRSKIPGEHARGIVYVSAASRTLAAKAITNEEAGVSKPDETLPEISIARLTVAECEVSEINCIYDNPTSDAPCKCATCLRIPPPSHPLLCNCSGCLPDTVPPLIRPPRASRVNKEIPKAKRLSKIQRAHATTRLLDFRIEIWKSADQIKFWMFPPVVFLPDAVIDSILNNFALLNTLPKVTQFVQPHIHLQPYPQRLREVLKKLVPELRQIAADRNAENAMNLKAKKLVEAEEAAALAAIQSEDSADSDGDVAMVDVEGLRCVHLVPRLHNIHSNIQRRHSNCCECAQAVCKTEERR